MMKYLWHRKATELLLALLLIIAPLYYHPNIGGIGLRIPSNITVWFMAVVIIFHSYRIIAVRSEIVLPRLYVLFLGFPIVVISSYWFQPESSEYFYRLLAICGGALFFIALFQYKFVGTSRNRVLLILIISGFTQGIIALYQVFSICCSSYPLIALSEGIPTGTFQQVNNMSVYQAVTFLCSLYFTNLPEFKKCNFITRLIVYCSVILAMFVIFSSGSRIGALSTFIGLIVMIAALSNRLWINKKKSVGIILLSILGGTIGTQTAGLEKIETKMQAMESSYSGQSDYSGSIRLVIYLISLDLIKQKPIIGHGAGSFPEKWHSQKEKFITDNPEIRVPSRYLMHPHNELLLWFVEGGIIHTLALIAFGLAILISVRKKYWRNSLAYLAMFSPIILHLQVELPFYTSSLLYFSFFLLLMLFVSLQKTIKVKYTFSVLAKRLVNLGGVVVFACTSIFLIHSLKANYEFHKFYETRDINEFEYAIENPYFHNDYIWLFHRTISYAALNGGRLSVTEYQQLSDWYKKTLQVKPDHTLFNDVIRLYQHQNKSEQACSLVEQAMGLYPDNKDFIKMKREINCQ